MSSMYARIETEEVKEVVRRPKWFMDDGSPVTDEFLKSEGYLPVNDTLPEYDPIRQRIHEKDLSEWIIGDAEVEVTYSVEDLPNETVLKNLSELAAAERWRLETKGLEVNGVLIATDEKSQNRILAARMAADADSDFTVQWKGADDNFTELDAATIKIMSDTILTYVNSLFTKESEINDKIRNGEITTREQIEQAFRS